jgi:hypothetical protein
MKTKHPPRLYLTRRQILARGVLKPTDLDDTEPDATRNGNGYWRIGNVRQMEASVASYQAAMALAPVDPAAPEEQWSTFYSERARIDNAMMADDGEVRDALVAAIGDMTPAQREALAFDLGKWTMSKAEYITLTTLNEKAA